jgi:hypothetical protein
MRTGCSTRRHGHDLEAGYEAVCRQPIAPERIVVLAPDELDWDPDTFLAMGGHMTFDAPQDAKRSPDADAGQPVSNGKSLNATATAILLAAQRMQASQVSIDVDEAGMIVRIDAHAVPHIMQSGVFTV